jgi:hypothetical protein
MSNLTYQSMLNEEIRELETMLWLRVVHKDFVPRDLFYPG